MMSRDDQDEFVLVQGSRDHARAMELPDEPDVELVALDLLDDLFRMAGPNDESNALETLDEPGQDPRQNVGADRWGCPDRQLPGDPSGVLTHLAPPRIQGLYRAIRVRHEGATGVRESHPSIRPLEQRSTELLLEQSDPCRERGLCDEQGRRCPAQVLLTRDLEKALDLGDQHGISQGIT